MENRTSTKQIVFRRPFHVRAVTGPLPAGTYTVRISDDGDAPSVAMGWVPAHIILELIQDGSILDVRMDAQELREALVHDGDQGTDPPANPGVGKRKPGAQRRRAF